MFPLNLFSFLSSLYIWRVSVRSASSGKGYTLLRKMNFLQRKMNSLLRNKNSLLRKMNSLLRKMNSLLRKMDSLLQSADSLEGTDSLQRKMNLKGLTPLRDDELPLLEYSFEHKGLLLWCGLHCPLSPVGDGFFPVSLLSNILCRIDSLIRRAKNSSRDGKTPALEVRKDIPLDLDGLK
jgi:hypothetical protein